MYLLKYIIVISFNVLVLQPVASHSQESHSMNLNRSEIKQIAKNILRLLDVADNKKEKLNGTRCLCCIQYITVANFNDYNLAFGICHSVNSTQQLDDEDYPISQGEPKEAPCPCEKAYFPSWINEHEIEFRPNKCQFCTAHVTYTADRFRLVNYNCNPVGERCKEYPPHYPGLCGRDNGYNGISD